MSTFTQLQTRVSANLIDVPTTVQTNVPVFVNAVIEAVQSINNFNCMKAEIQGVLTTNSTSSHLLCNTPQGFKEPRGAAYWIGSGGVINRIDWAPNKTYDFRQWNADASTTTGPPALLLLGETVTVNSSGVVTASSDITAGIPIYIYPYSDGAGPSTDQYPISIPYWAILPDLTGSSDVNWFTTYMVEFVVAAATKMAFEMMWDDGASSNDSSQSPGGGMGRAQYWGQQAFGPKWDGVNLTTAGGWLKVGLELDRRLGYSPIRTGV